MHQPSRPRPRSPKKTKEDLENKPIRDEYLASHPYCEIGYVLSRSMEPKAVAFYKANCRGEATEIHERLKRSQGGSLTDPANLMASCGGGCNGFIEDNPELCKQLGLVVMSYQDPQNVPVQRMTVE